MIKGLNDQRIEGSTRETCELIAFLLFLFKTDVWLEGVDDVGLKRFDELVADVAEIMRRVNDHAKSLLSAIRNLGLLVLLNSLHRKQNGKK